MPPTDFENALEGAALEVLETMFFATVMGAGTPPENTVAARVVFRGARRGCFTVGLSHEAVAPLALAFLGADEVSPPQAQEVVGEMANMICGSTLCRLWPEAQFELLHPEPARLEAVPETAAARRCMDLGDGTLTLVLEFEPNA